MNASESVQDRKVPVINNRKNVIIVSISPPSRYHEDVDGQRKKDDGIVNWVGVVDQKSR